MLHALLPVVMLPWLFVYERRAHMASFCRAFGWMNLLAVSTQIALPTAPPWFHDAYSNSPQANTRKTLPFMSHDTVACSSLPHPLVFLSLQVALPSYNQKGHPAGLLRMDATLGTQVFANGYSKSPVVYGAFPSMHCGWPFLLTLYYTGEYQKMSWGYSFLLAWAAMYLKHHFLTDVLGGWCYAVLAMKIADWGGEFEMVRMRTKAAVPVGEIDL